MTQLSESHFDQWPVWSEFYDADELDEISAWGIERRAFLEHVQALGLGNEHAVYTVLEFDPLPDRMRLYLRARFHTGRGDVLSGYIVNDDAYAGSLFAGGKEYMFNIHLRPEFTQMLDDLAGDLGASPNELLPIRYATDFRTDSGELVYGMIAFP